jgi:hypothetical protein
MDRATGESKGYGFAKFGSVEHARAFVEPNWPSVKWRERGQGPSGVSIKINYSQKTGGWREDQGAGARMTEEQRKAAGEYLSYFQTMCVLMGRRRGDGGTTGVLYERRNSRYWIVSYSDPPPPRTRRLDVRGRDRCSCHCGPWSGWNGPQERRNQESDDCQGPTISHLLGLRLHPALRRSRMSPSLPLPYGD